MKNKRTLKRAALGCGSFCFLAGLLLRIGARRVNGFADAYETHMNAFWVNTLGRLSSILPFSLCEMLLYAALAIVVVWSVRLVMLVVRWLRGRDDLSLLSLRRHLFLGFSSVFLIGGICFFLYEAGEDVYFFDTPFAVKYELQNGGYSTGDLANVCEILVERCNIYAENVDFVDIEPEKVSGEGKNSSDEATISTGGMVLAPDAAERARKHVSKLGDLYPEFKGYIVRPKGVLVSELMSYTQFSGIWTAITQEANYNADMPDYNKPFSMCHELSHSKGILRENEANFTAYLACVDSGDADFQYSAVVMGWIYCGNELYKRDKELWRECALKLNAATNADLDLNNAFWKRYEGAAGDATEKMNDQYLKSKGVTQGTESYDQVVDLIVTYELNR